MNKIALGTSREAAQPDCIQALIVEFICTFLFIFAGIASAMTAEKLSEDALLKLFFNSINSTVVVTAMISVGFRISGSHLNPAVTLALCIAGRITVVRSVLYWIDQCMASIIACALLKYLTGGLTPPPHMLANGMGVTQGLIMEMILTFSLMFTVYATILDPNKGFLEGMGPLLTGLLVGANSMAGGAFTGASMNPARSLGPALISGVWTSHWIYWVGPLVGSVLAGLIYENFFMANSYEAISKDDEEER